MDFIWNDLSVTDRDRLFAGIPKSNLLQSYPYAQMMRERRQMSTRFGRIEDEGETVGVMQIHEVRLGAFYHVVTLDRGPLWLPGKESPSRRQAFVRIYADAFPKRLGRRRRFMPEWGQDSAAAEAIEQAGFRLKAPGYQSIWADLRPDDEALRKSLKANWRGHLNKAERAGLSVDSGAGAANFNWLLNQYRTDRLQRRYRGPSAGILRSLYKFCLPRNEVLLLLARDGAQPVAGVLIFRHGLAATYQMGWSGDAGRQKRAHQLLLWQAMLGLKADGVEWFDLGGIHPQAAAGVTEFKQGLGGQPFQLAGLFV